MYSTVPDRSKGSENVSVPTALGRKQKSIDIYGSIIEAFGSKWLRLEELGQLNTSLTYEA